MKLGSICISIVTFNNADTIARCLDSLPPATPECPVRISIHDNASSDGTATIVRNHDCQASLVEGSCNIGFGAAHNRVLEGADEDALLVLNPDAWLEDEALTELLQTLGTDPGLAAVGPRMTYEDGRSQLSYGSFPGFWSDLKQRRFSRALQANDSRARRSLDTQLAKPFEPDWISASCVLLRQSAFAEVGGFDEDFFLYWEDVDLCRRLRDAGYRIRLQPTARCRHLEGYSQNTAMNQRLHFRRSRLLYENKHGSRLAFIAYKLLRARSVDLEWQPR